MCNQRISVADPPSGYNYTAKKSSEIDNFRTNDTTRR